MNALSLIQSANPGKWFRFNQNNSGGYFTGPAMEVFIRAESEREAWERLKAQPDYSNAFCECCGERWMFAEEVTPEEAVRYAERALDPNGYTVKRAIEEDVLPLLVVP